MRDLFLELVFPREVEKPASFFPHIPHFADCLAVMCRACGCTGLFNLIETDSAVSIEESVIKMDRSLDLICSGSNCPITRHHLSECPHPDHSKASIQELYAPALYRAPVPYDCRSFTYQNRGKFFWQHQREPIKCFLPVLCATCRFSSVFNVMERSYIAEEAGGTATLRRVFGLICEGCQTESEAAITEIYQNAKLRPRYRRTGNRKMPRRAGNQA